MKSKQLLPIFIIIIFPFFSCKKQDNKPNGVPQNATYDKKKNLYYFVENGIRKIWVETGELYSECEVDELGREHGACKNYMPNTGKIIAEGKNIHGERDGVWYWYFPNGQVYYKLTLAHDKKRMVWIETNLLGNEHGEYERFYESGSLEEKGLYDTGYKTGKWIKYYKDGKLEYQGEYLKDKKINSWKYFYNNGNPEAEEEFTKDGKLISRKTYFPDGEINCIVDSQMKSDCKNF